MTKHNQTSEKQPIEIAEEVIYAELVSYGAKKDMAHTIAAEIILSLGRHNLAVGVSKHVED